jgi:hypothetical protein
MGRPVNMRIFTKEGVELVFLAGNADVGETNNHHALLCCERCQSVADDDFTASYSSTSPQSLEQNFSCFR